MAKKRTWKRDRRGRFASTSGGGGGVRGALTRRRNARIEKKVGRVERNRDRINRDIAHPQANGGKPFTKKSQQRRKAANNAFHNAKVRTLRAKKR